MTRKYLVRRDNCRFIGPMTLHEFRDGIRKMTFGLEDEVAAHCSTWVVLDNEALVRKRYPELAAIIADELPAAWREATGHAKQITQKERRARLEVERKAKPAALPRAAERSRKNKQRKSHNRVVFIGVFVAVAATAAGAWIKYHEEPIPQVGELASLATQPDPTQFLNEMGLKLIPVVNRVSRGRDKEGMWLPYLRMYAFHTNGTVDNLPLRLLRGQIPSSAPQDCSVEAWKKRWVEHGPQVGAWMNHKTLAKNPWTKALAWDPAWIRRRTSKGWIKPRNWFEGCLMAASVAIRAVSSEVVAGTDTSASSAELVASVSRRLQTQLELIQLGKSSVPIDTSTMTGKLSCFDQSDSAATLESCRQKFPDTAVQQMEDEYAVWQMVRLALVPGTAAADTALQSALQSAVPRMAAEQPFSKLEYSAELQFARELVQLGFKTEGLGERISSQHQEVRLQP